MRIASVSSADGDASRLYVSCMTHSAHSPVPVPVYTVLLYWPCNLYAINNSAWAETRANRVRTNNNQLLLSDGSDAYSTVYAILQYGVRIRINECTASDAVRIGCVRIGINSAGRL